MFNAIFYLLRTGCQWRHLPHDYLRQTLRVLLGKNEDASAGIVDSQSVKTTEKGA